jgi:hypothetical protein
MGGFFAAKGLCACLPTGRHKAGKTAGLQSFRGATLSLYYPAMRKFFGSNLFFIGPQECFAVCYAPGPRTGRQFFLLSPEAYLLTGGTMKFVNDLVCRSGKVPQARLGVMVRFSNHGAVG